MAKITVEFVRELVESLDYPEVTYEQLAEIINEKASEPEWISVKELPKLGQFGEYDWVLAITEGGGIEKVWHEGVSNIWYGRYDNYGEAIEFNITHWMPLPNKPVNTQPK